MRNDRSTRRTVGWITAAVAASVVVAAGGMTASVLTVSDAVSAFSKAVASQSAAERAGYGYGSQGSSGGSGSSGNGNSYGYGYGQDGSGSSSSGTDATSSQAKGIVVIDTVLSYDQAEAAGTGMVLTSSGEILTNNHVVEGSTSIKVTVVSTGKTYTAKVVGTDATDDVAVLQLSGASGLTTASIGDSSNVSTGDNVTAVGNAGGTGSLTAASGTVTGTDKSITTQAESSVASESLSGLIETDAGIQSGDSGGPLYNSSGKVIAIDTAASADTQVSDGYAIPIDDALSIVTKIENGDAGSNITIGLPAFLGVEVASTDASTGLGDSGLGSGLGGSSGYGGGDYGYSGGDGSTQTATGATIAEVIDGTPAASAGLAAGDTITAVGGTTVTSSDGLTSALKKYSPGDSVSITWTDSSGASQTATVTLTSGPAA
ncbi:S1C family serine protease [Humibacter ginsenosidimutans]|nr:trypsin-like peptidase domain-containing protein [Humibacter ginsenosidimutans]